MIFLLQVNQTMRTCVDQLMALSYLDAPRLKKESQYLSRQLDSLKYSGRITNDAYLDAGSIQGAFEMIANLIDMGVAQQEIFAKVKGTIGSCKKT